MVAAQFVRSVSRLAAVPFVPEITLHQAEDIYTVWEQTERELDQAGLPPPFWAVAWPGGQALARYLLDHPALVTGKSVLDLGSGSGLVAIAAAKAGAATVTVSETDPVAWAAIGLNAAANCLPMPEWIEGVPIAGPARDVVMAGDVWYERELAGQVGSYLDRAASAGALVLAGDIGRSYFPRRRYRLLTSYEIPASIDLEGTEVVRASVWRADKAGPAGD